MVLLKMTRLTDDQLFVAFAHFKKSSSPETKNPVALLEEIGQKLHVAPRYSISKSNEPHAHNFYTCDVRFPGYQAKASCWQKKVSKRDAAKALLDQLVSDAKRRKIIISATEKTDAILKANKRRLAENPQPPDGKRQRMMPNLASSQQSALMPFFQFQGEIHYIQSQDQCAHACRDIMERSDKPVVCGFDIEWRPNFQKGQNNKTAVIQICPSEEDCYIFQVPAIGCIPAALRCLIEDKDIIKAGIGIGSDMRKLRSDFGLVPGGEVDLSVMYNRVMGSTRIWGLKSMVEEVLHKPFWKNRRATMSNWEQQLTTEQLMYAATDAFAGFMLYRKIKEMPGNTRSGLSSLGVSTSGDFDRKRMIGASFILKTLDTFRRKRSEPRLEASSQGAYTSMDFKREVESRRKRSKKRS